MFSIIGILVVFACVIGGFLMEKGKLAVLVQPAELVTIGGAAIGTVLAANPMHILKKLAGGLVGVIKGSPFSKQRYVDTLKMMFDLFAKSRKEGAIAIESDVEDPEKSPIFSRYPVFLGDHHARDFVCDTMRMAITGGVNPFDVDQMMDLDMEVHHHSANQPNPVVEQRSRRVARAGNRGRGARRGGDHGFARWAAGGNRTQGGCSPGRNLPGNFALLRSVRAAGREYVEDSGRGAQLLCCSAGGDARLY